MRATAMVNNFFLLVGSFFWHAWRIATLRPAFKFLGNSTVTLLTFFVVYLLAGSIRWIWLVGHPPANVVINLAIQVFIIFLLAHKTNRCMTLSASLLMCSAITDIVSIAFWLIFLDTPGPSAVWSSFVLEWFLYIWTSWMYIKEDFKKPENDEDKIAH
jgi:hypothetical protein